MLTLTGGPRERGFSHGEEMREEIARHLELWREDLRKDTGMSPDDYLNKFYKEMSSTIRTVPLSQAVPCLQGRPGISGQKSVSYSVCGDSWLSKKMKKDGLGSQFFPL
jgi:hypothetical protein